MKNKFDVLIKHQGLIAWAVAVMIVAMFAITQFAYADDNCESERTKCNFALPPWVCEECYYKCQETGVWPCNSDAAPNAECRCLCFPHLEDAETPFGLSH